ncbi:MAG: hypothetical protein JSU83_11575 [Deltaproteobacteria bacterium]|nr:MAG: hypothetical protein JSU83_11575 [Deltaproteobacteria bacterium]
MHALWAIGIILLLSFFILQVCIRLTAGIQRITTRALEKFKSQVDQTDTLLVNPVRSQLEAVLGLAALAKAVDD